MSSAHDAQKPSSPFGGSGPFRTFFFQRSSALPPKFQALLRAFEHTLEERFKALTPNPYGSQPHPHDVLTLSWMTSAVESLSRTHVDVKSLIDDLEFPLPHWDDHWLVDMYLDNTVKLLDMCIAISSDLSRLDQGQLFLQYALHSLDPPPDGRGPDETEPDPGPHQVQAATRSLREWARHIGSTSTKLLGDALPILQDLMRSLQPVAPHSASSSSKPKSSSAAKAKVLMQAMYGVKVQTIFVCGALAAALSGSEAALLDLQVPDKFLWSQSFRDLRAAVYAEIRSRSACSARTGRVDVVLLRDFQAVHVSAEKLLAVLTSNGTDQESQNHPPMATAVFKECIPELRESTQRLSSGMDTLSKQLTGFFQIVLTGRDALLCNLRMPGGDVK